MAAFWGSYSKRVAHTEAVRHAALGAGTRLLAGPRVCANSRQPAAAHRDGAAVGAAVRRGRTPATHSWGEQERSGPDLRARDELGASGARTKCETRRRRGAARRLLA